MVSIIRGTDKSFSIRLRNASTKEPFDLTGLTGTNLTLLMPGENSDLVLSLTANSNGSALTIPEPKTGRIVASISDIDTALLKLGESQNLEVTVKGGAGPDFDIKKVQFPNKLRVVQAYSES